MAYEEVASMSVSAADGAHEFVVVPELAEVAERLGVPLHAGDRVRFEVINGERETAPRRRRLAGSAASVPASTP